MNTKTLAVLLALAPAGVFAATERAQLELPAGQDTEVSIENLAGVMTIVGADSGALRVEVERVGATAELARAVTLKHRVDGDGIEIWLEYPSDNIVYDPEDGGSHNSRVSYRGDRVRVSSGGRGDKVHANVKVTVPRGVELRAFNAVGRIDVAGVHGELGLRTASGRIVASGGSGDWSLRSGSGRVIVEHFNGELDVHTGSGRVLLTDVEGSIEAETGSGRIEGEAVAGKLELSTGSGGIDLKGVKALGSFEGSTGSGAIRISGDLSGVDDLELTTGSGGIRLELAGGLNARLAARTGSGSIDIDLDNLRDVSSKRGRFEATVGNGEGRAALRTGSGSIRVRRD